MCQASGRGARAQEAGSGTVGALEERSGHTTDSDPKRGVSVRGPGCIPAVEGGLPAGGGPAIGLGGLKAEDEQEAKGVTSRLIRLVTPWL